MATWCCSMTRLIQPSTNSRTTVSSYRLSTIICPTRILGSCTSISSDVATRWRWRKEFERRWRSRRPPLYPITSGPETKPDLAKEIEEIIGYPGSMGGGAFHINVPRNDIHVAAMGAAIPSYMGMNTPLNFQLEA